MTTNELAEWCGVAHSTLMTWARKGKMEGVHKEDGHWVVDDPERAYAILSPIGRVDPSEIFDKFLRAFHFLSLPHRRYLEMNPDSTCAFNRCGNAAYYGQCVERRTCTQLEKEIKRICEFISKLRQTRATTYWKAQAMSDFFGVPLSKIEDIIGDYTQESMNRTLWYLDTKLGLL